MTRLTAVFLLAVVALPLAVHPRIAHCQSTLVPELVPFRSPPPANQITFADAYFPGTDYGSFQIDVQNNVITAAYHDTCMSNCPSPQYFVHPLTLPAVDAGSYTVKIVNANTPTQLIAQFPLVVGGEISVPPPAPQLRTPPQPLANHPFAVAGFFALPEGPRESMISGVARVSDNVITAPVELGCGFLCPSGVPSLSYGPFSVEVPALQPGVYTLNFMDPASPTTVVAQFRLVIQGASAAVDPTPALGVAGLCLLVASIFLAGCISVRRHGVAKDHRNSHG